MCSMVQNGLHSVMLHTANQAQSQMLNVLQKYKLVKILISSHPFNKIYLQAKKRKKKECSQVFFSYIR